MTNRTQNRWGWIIAIMLALALLASLATRPSQKTAPTTSPPVTRPRKISALTPTPVASNQAYCQGAGHVESGGSLYLSPLGSNGNPGTLASPKFDLAGWTPVANTTVYIRGNNIGTYTGWTPIAWGEPGGGTLTPAADHITIRNYPGETPLFSGAGVSVFMTLYGSAANNLTISGLTATLVTGGDSGFIIGTAGNTSTGLGGAPHHITIECNDFYKITQGHWVYFGGDGVVTNGTQKTNNRLHDWIVRYNDFYGADPTSAYHTGPATAQGAIHSFHPNGAYNITINNNAFINNMWGILVSAEGQDHWTIESNTFYGNRVAAINLSDYVTVPQCPHGEADGVCLDWQSFSTFVIDKNVIQSSAGQVGLEIETLWPLVREVDPVYGAPYGNPLPYTESNNDYFGGTCNIRWGGYLDGAISGTTCYTVAATWRARVSGFNGAALSPLQGVGDIVSDPAYVNVGNRDVSTPAINQASVNLWGCCYLVSGGTTTTTAAPTTTTTVAPTTTTTIAPAGTLTVTPTPACQTTSTFVITAAYTGGGGQTVTAAGVTYKVYLAGALNETFTVAGASPWTFTDNFTTGPYTVTGTATLSGGGTLTSAAAPFERPCSGTTTTAAPTTTTTTITPATTTTLPPNYSNLRQGGQVAYTGLDPNAPYAVNYTISVPNGGTWRAYLQSIVIAQGVCHTTPVCVITDIGNTNSSLLGKIVLSVGSKPFLAKFTDVHLQ